MRERIVIAAPLLIALALNAALVAGAVRLRRAEGQLQRSYAARSAVHGVVAGLSEVEAGLGAYMATGDPVFLEPFARTADALPARIEHLEEAVSDPGDAGEALKDLVAASRAHLEVLSRVRDQARTAGEMPRELVAAARRERQRVQASAARLIFREDERLAEGRAAAGVLQLWVVAAAAAAALAGLACGAIASILVSGRRAPASSAAARDTAARDDPAPASRSIGPASVLIVDDDRHIRELLQRWLRPHGVELRQAADAQSALAAVTERVPAVIVCDIHMPGRNGLWLAERVRAAAPACAIVLATGDETVPPFESLKNGVVAYVLKPFRREQLIAAVQDGVRWSAAQAGTTAAQAGTSSVV